MDHNDEKKWRKIVFVDGFERRKVQNFQKKFCFRKIRGKIETKKTACHTELKEFAKCSIP